MPKIPCVLLFDDDPTTNFLNRKLLLRLGVTDKVCVALNGQQALHELLACQEQPAGCPVLICLNVNMPVMGGLEFLQAYQQLPPARQSAVVVMLTTSVNSRDQRPATQLPVADCLAKPLTQQQVEQVVAQHFT